MIEIKQAFETKIATLTALATAYEGLTFNPTNNVPYQELYLMPSLNDNYTIDSANYISYGIFQVTLKYPTGTNASKNILERVGLLLNTFKSGDNLIHSGITINILNSPNVKNMGTIGDRLVYIVSINYQAFYAPI